MVQLYMHGVVDDMRVSLICLLLVFGRWNLLLYGALANPYHHEYGKYEDGSTVYGSGPEMHNPEKYSGLDQKLKIQQPNLSSNKQRSAEVLSKVKLRISPSHYESGLPEHHQNPVSQSTSLDGLSMFQHPSRGTDISQIGLASSMGERIPQDTSQGMNNIYPEGSPHTWFRSAAGGFTQNAPGSLYPSNPSETFVHTVPYFSINREYPAHDQLQNNHLAQQSTHFTEPGRSYPVGPISNLGYPSQNLVGLEDNTQSMTYDPSLQDSNSDKMYVSPSSEKRGLAPGSSNAGHNESNASKLTRDQDAPVNGKWAFQRLVSSNSVPIQSVSSWSYGGQRPNKKFGSSHRTPVHHSGSDFDMSYFPQRDQVPNQKIFRQPAKMSPASHINSPSQVDGSIDSLKNWATTDEDQVSELHPFTDLTSQNSLEEPPRVGKSPTVETGDASSGSTRGDADLHQSFERRHKASIDRKRLIKLRPLTRHLVKAFNHYEQGRLYQSHGRNHPTKALLPSDDTTLLVQQVQNTEEPKNGYRR